MKNSRQFVVVIAFIATLGVVALCARSSAADPSAPQSNSTPAPTDPSPLPPDASPPVTGQLPGEAPPQDGCLPISLIGPDGNAGLALRIGDCDTPGAPGWPSPSCPVDPNKPGGAKAAPCTPPKDSQGT